MELTFATLMASAADEPDAMYGLAARAVRISPDGLVYRFALRPEARFHDGTKLTAQDAAFSLNLLKEKGHPIIQQRLRDMAGAEADRRRRLWSCASPKSGRATCRCSWPACRFSRAPITRRRRSTNRRSTRRWAPGPTRSAGSRPAAISNIERVADWWGADLPVSVGQNNFDIVRYEYYRDREVGFEGFTAQELSVPRGIHLAHLGDALRFSGDQGRPRQARRPARRYAVRRARLVHQYAAAEIRRSAAARGAELRLRFRMDQQDHHVRRLSAHRSRCSRIPT